MHTGHRSTPESIKHAKMSLYQKSPMGFLGGLVITTAATLLTTYFGGEHSPPIESLASPPDDEPEEMIQQHHQASSSQPDAVSDLLWNTLYWVFDKAAWYGLSVAMFALGQCAARLQRWAEDALRIVYRRRNSETNGAMINISLTTTHVLESPVSPATPFAYMAPPSLDHTPTTSPAHSSTSPAHSSTSPNANTPTLPLPQPMGFSALPPIPTNFFEVPKRTGLVRSATHTIL